MGLSGCFAKIKTAFHGNTTLKDLYAIKTEHGPLLSAAYYKGGGMAGDSYSVELMQQDGKAVVIVKIRGEHWMPLRVYEYRAAENAFSRVREYIDRYNLSAWEALPFDEEHVALDAPSSHIYMRFDDTEISRYPKSVTVSFENKIPDGGYEILRGFPELLYSCYTADDLQETYLLNADGEKITVGRGVENSDADREALLIGYWRSETVRTVENGKITEERQTGDDEYVLYDLYAVENGMRVIMQTKDARTEADYDLSEYVSEPLLDYDASWYAVFRERDGENVLYFAADHDRIYMISGLADGGDDYQVTQMKRNDL